MVQLLISLKSLENPRESYMLPEHNCFSLKFSVYGNLFVLYNKYRAPVYYLVAGGRLVY